MRGDDSLGEVIAPCIGLGAGAMKGLNPSSKSAILFRIATMPCREVETEPRHGATGILELRVGYRVVEVKRCDEWIDQRVV